MQNVQRILISFFIITFPITSHSFFLNTLSLWWTNTAKTGKEHVAQHYDHYVLGGKVFGTASLMAIAYYKYCKLCARLKKAEDNIAKLTTCVANTNQSFNGLNQSFNEFNASVGKVNNRVKYLKKRTAVSERNILSLRAEVDQVKSAVQDKDGKYTPIDIRIARGCSAVSTMLRAEFKRHMEGQAVPVETFTQRHRQALVCKQETISRYTMQVAAGQHQRDHGQNRSVSTQNNK